MGLGPKRKSRRKINLRRRQLRHSFEKSLKSEPGPVTKRTMTADELAAFRAKNGLSDL